MLVGAYEGESRIGIGSNRSRAEGLVRGHFAARYCCFYLSALVRSFLYADKRRARIYTRKRSARRMELYKYTYIYIEIDEFTVFDACDARPRQMRNTQSNGEEKQASVRLWSLLQSRYEMITTLGVLIQRTQREKQNFNGWSHWRTSWCEIDLCNLNAWAAKIVASLLILRAID